MGSPSFWGKLANFTAASRKNALIPFGSFSPNDNLGFIADISTPPASQTSVAWASTLNINVTLGNVITILLTGNVSVTNLIYPFGQTPVGTWVYIRFQQDGTGGWTVTLPTDLVTDTGFAVDPTPLRTTVLPIAWNGTKWVFFGTPFTVSGQ